MLVGDGGGGGSVVGGVALPSMDGFVKAAAAGDFAVNDSGGQAMLSAIRDLAAWVDDNLSDASVTSRALPLGSSKGAQVMKPYMQDVFTDDQGFFTRLRQFRASLTAAEEAINTAMQNYHLAEDGAKTNFRTDGRFIEI